MAELQEAPSRQESRCRCRNGVKLLIPAIKLLNHLTGCFDDQIEDLDRFYGEWDEDKKRFGSEVCNVQHPELLIVV